MNKTLPCYIVSDLLPLYQEDILSEETKKDIDEHLKECEGCKEDGGHANANRDSNCGTGIKNQSV